MLTELGRLNRLSRFDIVDTAPDQSFDRLTSIAAKLLSVPVALLTFRGDNRQWVKSAHGYLIQEVPRELTSFCDDFLGDSDLLVIRDTLEHPRFNAHPVVPGAPNVRFYAGVALNTPEGATIGTICVFDFRPQPAFSEASLSILRDLALVAMDLLERRKHAARSERLFQQNMLMQRTNGLMAAAPDMATAIHAAASTLADEHSPISVRILVRSSIETAFQSRVFWSSPPEPGGLSGQVISKLAPSPRPGWRARARLMPKSTLTAMSGHTCSPSGSRPSRISM